MKVSPMFNTAEKSFPLPLIVSPLPDGRRWRLKRPFEFIFLLDGERSSIMVHEDFITDFASIPRIFWAIIGGPWGKYGKAAVIHDYLYKYGLYTRKIDDRIFLLGMQILNTKDWREILIYYAVRIGAWKAWNDHRKKEKEKAK